MNWIRRRVVLGWLRAVTVVTVLGLASPEAGQRLIAAPPEVGAERVGSLIRQLGSDNLQERDQASQELVRIGDPALEALRRSVKDPDPEVGLRTKICLETIKAIGALKDPDPKVRSRALITLTSAGPHLARRVVPRVVEMLDDPDQGIVGQARDLLCNWRKEIPEAKPLLVAMWKGRDRFKLQTRELAVQALTYLLDGSAPSKVAASLREALLDPEETIRLAAVEGICLRGENLSEFQTDVRHFLDNQDEAVIRITMGSLWMRSFIGKKSYSDAEAKFLLPSLLRLAKQPKWRLRSIKTISVVGLNNPDAMAFLIDCLKPEEPPEICVDAAVEIGWTWGPRRKAAIPALIKALDDKRRKNNTNTAVQDAAAIALGNIGPAAAPAIPKLMELVGQEKNDSQRHSEKVRALGQIDGDVGKQVQAILDQEQRGGVLPLPPLGPKTPQ